MRFRKTIGGRIAIAYATFSLATLALLVAYFYVRIGRSTEHQIDRFMDDEFSEMEHMLLEGDDELRAELELVARFHREVRLFVEVRDESGKPLFRTSSLGDSEIPFSEAARALAPGESLRRQDARVAGTDVRVRTRRVPIPGGGTRFLQVAIARTEALDAQQRVLSQALAAVGPFVLLALLGGWIVARRAIRPIDAIAATAARIQAANLSERVPQTGYGDELDQLAGVLNTAFSRLEDAFRRVRDFSGSASHQIRTPLTVIRGEAELLLKDGVEDRHVERLATIVDEAARLSRIVEQLLFLARVDAEKVDVGRDRVDLREVVARGLRRLEPVTATKRLRVEERGEARLEVTGSESLLATAIQNLLDNAVRYTPETGRVVVRFGREGERAVLDVEDDGEGIRAEDRARLMERFFRGDVRKGEGVGLGLAVAREIAVLHRGALTVEEPKEGLGAHFRMTFPAGSGEPES